MCEGWAQQQSCLEVGNCQSPAPHVPNVSTPLARPGRCRYEQRTHILRAQAPEQGQRTYEPCLFWRQTSTCGGQRRARSSDTLQGWWAGCIWMNLRAAVAP